MSSLHDQARKRPKLDLSDELRAGLQLSTLRPEDVTKIFNGYPEHRILRIESCFVHEFRDDFVSLQSRLLTAQLPWKDVLTERRLQKYDYPEEMKVNKVKRLAILLNSLAASDQITSQAVKDAIRYREATCAAYAVFNGPVSQCKSELELISQQRDGVKYFESLVEASERHLASLPQPTPPVAAAKAPSAPISDTTTTTTSTAASANPPAAIATVASISSSSTENVATTASNNDALPFSDEHLRNKVSGFIVDKDNLKNVTPWSAIDDSANVKQELLTSWYAITYEDPAYHSTPPGILLHGDQGTGKSTIVHSFAAWKDLTLFEVGGSIHGSLRGQSEKLVQYLFDEVRAVAAVKPCVLFFDEVDGLLGGSNSASSPFEGMVKSLWGKLIDDNVACFVFGATNKPWLINMADYSRRFAIKVHVTKPGSTAREQALKQSLSKFWHVIDENEWEDLAAATDGYGINDINAGVKKQTRALLRELMESSRWVKLMKDGQYTWVAAVAGEKVATGPRAHFQPSRPRPITADMIKALFQDGSIQKITSEKVEREHQKWNK